MPNKILVSACLAGINCTYLGKNNLNDRIKRLVADKGAVALCPEVMGGLGVPRENIELVGGDGCDVLDGRGRAVCCGGKDVTKELISGARSVLAAAEKNGIREAILKANSPACGAGFIYDGTFSKKLKPGYGVLSALLIRSGISVKNEGGA